MNRTIVTTKDGSKTIKIEDWNEHYHSTHGAVLEAKHVYIGAGLDYFHENHKSEPITVLEAGFGSGLNALLACFWSEKQSVRMNYIGLEAYPVAENEWKALDYSEQIQNDSYSSIYEKLHESAWETTSEITSLFTLKKHHSFFSDLQLDQKADVVFYDAFGPRVQPELWEKSIFENFYRALKPNGVFVTYSVKGTARRALEEIGFKVDVIEGPPGKRHMMRAEKL
jgi:tRNA U34 5-methylaminomethyl-2-thiouridine-forming methyltransferase MnmC